MDDNMFGIDPEYFDIDDFDRDNIEEYVNDDGYLGADFAEDFADNFLSEYESEEEYDGPIPAGVDNTDTSHMSWESLATGLGYAEEMLDDSKRKRISVAEYKSSDNKSRSKPKFDGRPFERYVNGKLAMIAQMEAGKPHPIDALISKMEIVKLSYHDIRKALLTSNAALQSDYVPQDINFLNLNICLDLISLINGCIFLDTKDTAYVLTNNIEEVHTPQMRMIKKWLGD